MAKILNGKIVNEKIAKNLSSQISPLRSKPKLVIIQVGDLAESNSYIARKKAFGEKIGAIVDHHKFPNNIREEKLITHISSLNTDPTVHGIIVQMPLPDHLDKDKIIESITPVKDVDGLTSTNLKLLWEGKEDGYTPATTKGVLTLLDYYKIPISGKNVVVVGRSFLVGKPTALAFLNKDATVTVCHSKTPNLKQETRKADILVVAAGKPKFIGPEHVSKNQIVVDVGINVVEGRQTTNDKRLFDKAQGKPESEPATRKLVGDVDFDSVKDIVSAISLVPGGIGPMTVASLFENLLEAYLRQT